MSAPGSSNIPRGKAPAAPAPPTQRPAKMDLDSDEDSDDGVSRKEHAALAERLKDLQQENENYRSINEDYLRMERELHALKDKEGTGWFPKAPRGKKNRDRALAATSRELTPAYALETDDSSSDEETIEQEQPIDDPQRLVGMPMNELVNEIAKPRDLIVDGWLAIPGILAPTQGTYAKYSLRLGLTKGLPATTLWATTLVSPPPAKHTLPSHGSRAYTMLARSTSQRSSRTNGFPDELANEPSHDRTRIT
ncbi:hypothetical protein PG987_016388 [Apiospora arundinis]